MQKLPCSLTNDRNTLDENPGPHGHLPFAFGKLRNNPALGRIVEGEKKKNETLNDVARVLSAEGLKTR